MRKAFEGGAEDAAVKRKIEASNPGAPTARFYQSKQAIMTRINILLWMIKEYVIKYQ